MNPHNVCLRRKNAKNVNDHQKCNSRIFDVLIYFDNLSVRQL